MEQELADGRGSRDRLAPYKEDASSSEKGYGNGKGRSPTRNGVGAPSKALQMAACLVSPVSRGGWHLVGMSVGILAAISVGSWLVLWGTTRGAHPRATGWGRH